MISGTELEAGRELDELVLTQVLGFRRIPSSDRVSQKWSRDTETEGEVMYFLPPYSTAINCAWDVVERLHELGWIVELCVDSGVGRYCKTWRLANNGNVIVGADIQDEMSMPLTICAAALETVQPI